MPHVQARNAAHHVELANVEDDVYEQGLACRNVFPCASKVPFLYATAQPQPYLRTALPELALAVTEVLRSAIAATFARRERLLPNQVPVGLSDAFSADQQKQRQWQAFLKKNQLENIELAVVVQALRVWLAPLLMEV